MPNLRFAIFAVAVAVIAAPAWAAPLSSARASFVARCTPRMMSHMAKYPIDACSCLHDNVVASVPDDDLRAALVQNIEEKGLPGISYEAVPVAKRRQIDAMLTRLARPALACMFGSPVN